MEESTQKVTSNKTRKYARKLAVSKKGNKKLGRKKAQKEEGTTQ